MKHNISDTRREQNEISNESNDRYPKVTTGWGWTHEDELQFLKSKQRKYIKRAIKSNESRIKANVRRNVRLRFPMSYKNYIKWLVNDYRCTLKELQSALKYTSFVSRVAHGEILSEIKRGFYKEG